MTQPTHLLGVDIGGTNLRVALANANGEIVARVSATTTNVRDAESVVRKIGECAQQLLQERKSSAGTGCRYRRRRSGADQCRDRRCDRDLLPDGMAGCSFEGDAGA